MATPLQKRANDLFISYGHADQAAVERVTGWLRLAGLKLWYDASSGSASQRTTDLLTRGIESARGALFFLSPNWDASTWCRDEHEVALTQRRANEEFLVIAAQIAEISIPAWLQTAQVLDLRAFDVLSATSLLRSLSPSPPSRVDNRQDVYFAGPWSNRSVAAQRALPILGEMGWRLIGDSPDHPRFTDDRQRIMSIVRSCIGLIAILPFRPENPTHHTSIWILEEVRIAIELGRPCVLLAENGVVVPHDVTERAEAILPLADTGLDRAALGTLQAFDDTLSHVLLSPAGSYSFLAASLLGDERESDALVTAVETVTNMTCVRGRDLSGQHAQDAIVEQIRGAAFVIADITDDNRNSLIEAGVARGAGVPLHLVCQLPANGSRKTRFMLQDMEVNWYSNPLERLGMMYRIARKYRRRVYASSAGRT